MLCYEGVGLAWGPKTSLHGACVVITPQKTLRALISGLLESDPAVKQA